MGWERSYWRSLCFSTRPRARLRSWCANCGTALKARFDFTVADPAETPDLFSGSFKRSTTARRIYSFRKQL